MDAIGDVDVQVRALGKELTVVRVECCLPLSENSARPVHENRIRAIAGHKRVHIPCIERVHLVLDNLYWFHTVHPSLTDETPLSQLYSA